MDSGSQCPFNFRHVQVGERVSLGHLIFPPILGMRTGQAPVVNLVEALRESLVEAERAATGAGTKTKRTASRLKSKPRRKKTVASA